MTKKTQKIIGGIAIVVILLLMINSSTDIVNLPFGGRSGGEAGDTTATYVTSTNTLVRSGETLLERIIVWGDTTSSVLVVYNDNYATSSSSLIFELRGDSLAGSYEVGHLFSTGLMVDTNVTTTFIYIKK